MGPEPNERLPGGLRRLDCVLEATKPAVLAELAAREKAGLNPAPFLLRKSGQLFYNTSPFDLKKLMGDQDHKGKGQPVADADTRRGQRLRGGLARSYEPRSPR